MTRGNDAIPTWSGFNYQGKIMLLYILNLINQIQMNKDKKKYSVELERTEDFCIICDKNYISVHQVKAWLSTNKWCSYCEAMDKLLSHRNKINPTAKCYLMVAREVDDWNDASNTYNSSIELYKYKSQIIGVCDVSKRIMSEIEVYLAGKGYDKRQSEIVYGELCLYLEDQIAIMHKQGGKKRKHKILFSSFIEIIEEAVKKERVREEFLLKERVYDYIMKNMEKALEDLCQDECDNSFLNCSDESCAAKAAYDKLMEISDYTNFCKLLNPAKIDGWDNPLALVENFPVSKLQIDIYDLLYKSKNPKKIIGNSNSIYLQSKFSNSKSGQIIPTLLDLTRGQRSSNALQRIFQNIINNTDIKDILEGKSITFVQGDFDGKLSQEQISAGWRESNPDKKVSDYYRDIVLISSKELLHKFEVNGGNL